jgi:hypothetical protein
MRLLAATIIENPLTHTGQSWWREVSYGGVMLSNSFECTPDSVVTLLKELERCGFNDQAFRLIHHKTDATIKEHERYCGQKIASFQPGGKNELVLKCLLLVRNAFRAGPFSAPASPGVFAALARAAASEIPI